MKPFLKWPGGKRRLAERILSELPPSDTYVEPFLGAGAVALLAMHRKKYQHYVLADADQDLIVTWLAIRDELPGVLEYQNVLQQERDAAADQKSHYYAIRNAFNTEKGDSAVTAARLLYLNTYTYNGLYRKNSSGGFNAPYGYPTQTNKKATPPSAEKLSKISMLLNSCNVCLRCNDFSEVGVPEGAVGYYDPPYWPRQGNGFTQYTAKGFTETDQEDLAEHFKEQLGVCLMTNGPGALHLYGGCAITSLNEPTVIGPKKAQRGAAETLLIRNKPTWH